MKPLRMWIGIDVWDFTIWRKRSEVITIMIHTRTGFSWMAQWTQLIVREAVKWVEARKSFSYDLTVPYCLITVWCTDSLTSATTGCWTRSTVAGRLFEEDAYVVVENIARLNLHGLKRAHRPVRVRNHPVTRRAPWLEAWPLRWMMMTMTVIGLPSQVYRLVVLLL